MIYETDSDEDCWLEIATPVITSPPNNTINVSILGILNIVVSAFQPQMPGISLTGTDLEIRTAPNGGGTLVYSSASALSIPALTLALGTDYYIRVRQKSGIYLSLWSNDVKITTSLV